MGNDYAHLSPGRWPLLVATVMLGCVLLVPSLLFAHAPHDKVDAIVLSPAYQQDGVAYGIVRGNLVKSLNRGVSWQRLIHGLTNDSSFTSLAIAPRSPAVIFASTRQDGIYKSEDAGKSWFTASDGIEVKSIRKLYMPDSQGDDTVFAVGFRGEIYVTDDGGNLWKKVYDAAAPITAISGFAAGAADGDVIIGDSTGELSLTTNGGVNWQHVHSFLNCAGITSIGTGPGPSLRDTFFVGTKRCGVFQTTDGGHSFQRANSGITDLNIQSLALSPAFSSDGTLFASSWSQAVFVSRDAGASWKQYADGLSTADQARISGKPDFGDLALSPNFERDDTVFLAGFDGLFKSQHGGRQWQAMDILPSTLIQSIALSPAFETDGTLALTTYVGKIFMSADGGATWNGILESARNFDIIFSPVYARDGTIFATTSHNRVARSRDRGMHWTWHMIQAGGELTMIALSHDFAEDETLFVGSRRGKIYRSIDGGDSYSAVFDEWSERCSECVTAVAMSPDFRRDNTIYAATSTGIHVSTDKGTTWSSRGASSTFGDNVKIAISPNYAIDRTVFAGGTAGLFRSVDGFQTWKHLSASPTGATGHIEEIALSPNFKNDNTILVTVRGRGLFKSTNRGNGFRPIASSLIKNNQIFALWRLFPTVSSSAIRFSPAYATDRTIFAHSSNRVFRTRDGGNSWATSARLLDSSSNR